VPEAYPKVLCPDVSAVLLLDWLYSPPKQTNKQTNKQGAMPEMLAMCSIELAVTLHSKLQETLQQFGASDVAQTLQQ
jgi:hypothetical protein